MNALSACSFSCGLISFRNAEPPPSNTNVGVPNTPNSSTACVWLAAISSQRRSIVQVGGEPLHVEPRLACEPLQQGRVVQVGAVLVTGVEQQREERPESILALPPRGLPGPQSPEALVQVLIRLVPRPVVRVARLLVDLCEREGPPRDLERRLTAHRVFHFIQPHGCIENERSAEIVVNVCLLRGHKRLPVR